MRRIFDYTYIRKKTFLKSFVERIEVDDEFAKVVYTMPMLPEKASTEIVGVPL